MSIIPKKFSVGALDYKVEIVENLRYGEEFGHWDGTTCTIRIAKTAGGEPLSDRRKEQTFFHELIHAVLDSIGEDELNENEQFIDAFSNALSHAFNSMEE